MKQINTNIRVMCALVALTAGVAACGGGDDTPAAPPPVMMPPPPPPPPPDPLAAVPDAARMTVAGLIAYLQSLTQLLSETRDPIEIAAITSLPTADDAEPTPLN